MYLTVNERVVDDNTEVCLIRYLRPLIQEKEASEQY